MLKPVITLLLLATICLSNADAQYLFVSSDLETEGTKTSTYTVPSPRDISVRFVHASGFAQPPLNYPLIFASRVRVYINDVLQFTSGGNLTIMYFWNCYLDNVQTSSVVKVVLDFALFGPAYPGNPPATIVVTSQYSFDDGDVEQVGNSPSPQNFPNPFNPVTTISYRIREKGFVSLKVYDLIGREVANLVNETKDEGEYFVSFNARNLPSGVYIYSLRVNDFAQNNKMTVLK